MSEPTQGAISNEKNGFLAEIVKGLSQEQKTVPPKFLYDQRGSELFTQIAQLTEYYPTRTEMEILRFHAREIAELIGPNAVLIEPGSGSGEKIRCFLDALISPAAYVPIEISKSALSQMVVEMKRDYPRLKLLPLCADFTDGFALPSEVTRHSGHSGKRVVFFPGSTIGNLDPADAVSFLKKWAAVVGVGGGLLIGVDLKKDEQFFLKAYDDSKGVTAEFNLNLLRRLNRELLATFDLKKFKHQAIYNAKHGRVEMHLVSQVPQTVNLNGKLVRFARGESIQTESSYKYTVAEFSSLAERADFKLAQHWEDENSLFSVYYFNLRHKTA